MLIFKPKVNWTILILLTRFYGLINAERVPHLGAFRQAIALGYSYSSYGLDFPRL